MTDQLSLYSLFYTIHEGGESAIRKNYFFSTGAAEIWNGVSGVKRGGANRRELMFFAVFD